MSEIYTQGMEYVPVTLVECPSLSQICKPDTLYRGEETVFYLKLTEYGLSVQAVTFGRAGDWMCLSQNLLMKSDESDTTSYWH